MPFTLMPFLYQTRTILRIQPQRASAAIVRSFHTGRARNKKPEDIPFDYEVGRPEYEEEVPPTGPDVKGTITPSERLIFERIFADIQARGLKPNVTNDTPETGNTGGGGGHRSAMLIMQQAAYESGQSRPTTISSPALLTGASSDRAKALMRFPPELRNAASRALNAIYYEATGRPPADQQSSTPPTKTPSPPKTEWKSQATSFDRTLEVDNKRAAERARVEGLITDAKTDFELWDVLEKEVFTMPARMGIVRGNGQESDSKPRSRKRKASRKAAASEQTVESAESTTETANVEDTPSTSENASSTEEADTLSIYLHGPLYPAYLLLALRRLDTAFGAPSQLVHNLLPRIKELGLESYVLGVSTPFFNELISINWTRRGNLSRVLELLEEMRHCGLYFDKRTASLLNDIDDDLHHMADNYNSGGFGQALMTMPEYEPVQRERVQQWQNIVDISINERARDMEYIEEAV
ncbi:hypothetical protein GGS20DRAFT_164397 [Poronia punctata]|nr:hypothetical protein GGS20DRAFT_164397 [Poronia punctata]